MNPEKVVIGEMQRHRQPLADLPSLSEGVAVTCTALGTGIVQSASPGHPLYVPVRTLTVRRSLPKFISYLQDATAQDEFLIGYAYLSKFK